MRMDNCTAQDLRSFFLSPVDERPDLLCKDFSHYLECYETARASHTGRHVFRLREHLRTIRLRSELGGAREAIKSDQFVRSIWETLHAWGMNARGAKIQDVQHFIDRFYKHREVILALEHLSIADICGQLQLVDILRSLIFSLKLSAVESQVVAGSKALHHILPRLMPPIDRAHTCDFFDVASPDGPQQFRRIVEGYARIAQCLAETYGDHHLTSLVGQNNWSTSETKLLDNAIIGWVKRKKALQKQLRDAR